MTTFVDPFAEDIWAQTYKDHSDNTVNDTFKRVATAVASVEDTEELRQYWAAQFEDMLSDFKGTCGGRTYSNAGTEWSGTTLLNCFVSPRRKENIDSMDNIIQDLRNQVMTLKSEGGWGQDFSWLRPRGTFIEGIGVETPGAVKFMEMYDKSSEIVTAGSGRKSKNAKAKGKIRKGAMMGVIACWHPDVIEFVTAKQQAGRLTKFNISVNCTDEFMQRVIKIRQLEAEVAQAVVITGEALTAIDEQISALDKWDLIYPDTMHARYRPEWDGSIKNWLDKGLPVVVHNTVSVKWLWNLIMESTYNRAEPGVLFLDRANEYNPANYIETIVATNPCGEQTLAPGGVCCLGSLNLTQFVNADGTDLDYDRIAKYAKIMVRFLDNVNQYSSAPLPEYVDSMRNKRRVGVGILGWGSALFMIKTRFASAKANAIRDRLMQTIARSTYEASIDLAVEKGKFTYCDPEAHAKGKFINSIGLSDEYMAKVRTTGIRNSSLLSIQPTGNTGIFANVVSGGLEPIFMTEYIRTVIVSSAPDEIAAMTPKWYEGEWRETELFKAAKEGDEDILRGVFNGTVYKIDRNRGLLKEVPCIDYGVRYLQERGEWDPTADWAVTALSGLTAEDHLNDLVGFTRYIDSAASKTINLPFEYSYDDFQDIYIRAYQSGHIKGVTTYRSGTMTAVLSSKENETNGYDEEVILDHVKMNDSSEASMKTLKAEGVKFYVTVVWNETKTRPQALFVQTNHREKSVVTHDAVDHLIELATVKGIPQRFIDDVTHKMSQDNNTTKIARAISLLLRHGVLIKSIVAALDKVEQAYVGSFVFHIKKFLATFIKDGEKAVGMVCSNCGSTNIVYQEGCSICKDCSSSKCS